MGAVLVVLIFLMVLGWTPKQDSFVDQQHYEEANDPPYVVSEYQLVEDAEVGAEISVADIVFRASEDGEYVSWAASFSNPHTEYAATFVIEVTAVGGDETETEEFEVFTLESPLRSGESVTFGNAMSIYGLPDVTEVTVSITELAWFETKNAEPLQARTAIGFLVEEIEIASDRSTVTFHLTVDNVAAYAYEVDYFALFYDADGALLGGAEASGSMGDVLPPGTSTRVLEIPRFSEPPAGADFENTMILAI
ncbi:hypothetical protein [Glycomyces buryatensis]|uniref:Uncharacterized protein n=1 Tax=Glycomyces buryatensis TaxID=2570927 RepID=A0A4S8QD04_9ACTN|nr:hypothetical protein [Glycomyces buryatensis]THV42403.1 hypothetical protein FAB82_07050 [Glycomyces buryatensis]